ncbi:hypothetical protein EGT74_27120 [Chitinophaga lutea]|uniref:Uncharacterized protein n=2 Tax=Chitinophaga lutea TaxID=2488634 RepID=A0A3N4PBK6_9BACT|nr:hypothetical protein EGT74_27120 [Chitinophaga lutea]
MLFLGTSAMAQNAAEQLSHKIADKMRDTLDLRTEQRNMIYGLNMQLYHQKAQARSESKSPDSVRVKIQRIENGRDSLYKAVLTDAQYRLYLSRKRSLINNN